MNHPTITNGAGQPEYPDDYYEHIARTLGEEQAAWARLPRAEREAELRRLYETSSSPDDWAIWPPELGGRPRLSRCRP